MSTWLSRRFAFVAVAVTMAAGVSLSGSAQRAGTPADRDRFIGGWRLVSLEEQAADGSVHKADCTGLFPSSRETGTRPCRSCTEAPGTPQLTQRTKAEAARARSGGTRTGWHTA